MKPKDPTAPVTIRRGRTGALVLLIVGAALCALTLLFSLLVEEFSPLYCILVVVCFVPMLLLTLLLDLQQPRITVSAEGIELHHTRKGWRVLLPWSDYAYMYRLSGYKTTQYLFTAKPMDKPAQFAAYEACRQNRERPRIANGCLLLTDGFDNEILSRIPEHIQIVPEYKCCTFWDGYRKLP